MESCYGGMATRLKQRAVTEFLSAENVTPAEIHRRLPAVYGENTVNRNAVNRWAIKFSECEPGRAKSMPSAGKILLTVFWDPQRVYMAEFLEAVNTVNSARYIETIKNLRRSVCRVRQPTSRILLLHDNARPHTARAGRSSLRFPPIRPTALTWCQVISISFLTSREISRGLISPQMMK